MVIKIDSKDKSIINELWQNARQSDSVIAKKVGLSREVVRYRIERLEQKGVIKHYFTMVDTAKLGYITFQVYLRLQNFDMKKEKEIIKKIRLNPYVKWLIDMSGQYDLFFVMVGKSRAALDEQLQNMYSEFESHVADNLILSTIKIYKDMEFFYSKRKIKKELNRYSGKSIVDSQPETDKIELKKIDYEILDIISVNARMNVVEIARILGKRKFKITPEAVSYRLKKLQEIGVLRGFRAVLDYMKIGYQWYMLLVNLQMVPKRLEMVLGEQLLQNDKIIYADKVLGEWDI